MREDILIIIRDILKYTFWLIFLFNFSEILPEVLDAISMFIRGVQ